jgi:hypothetical protein
MPAADLGPRAQRETWDARLQTLTIEEYRARREARLLASAAVSVVPVPLPVPVPIAVT